MRALILVTVLAGCASERGPIIVVDPPMGPVIVAASARANPRNALSAVVVAATLNADSAAVVFHPLCPAAAADSATPAVRVVADSAVIPVLGLFPACDYTARVEAYGMGVTVRGEAIAFVTDTLPSDLPQFTADGSDPSPGFVAFAAGSYGLAIDNTGRVVWYVRFPNGPGLNFQAQPTGRYVARPPTPQASPPDNAPWIEIDPLGNVTRTFGCAGRLDARFHDVIVEPGGAYWILCDETRPADLTGVGGVANALVTGTVVQHRGATGDLRFQWSAFDHFQITDLDSSSRAGRLVNWTHANALDLDTDGNLLVSFRSLSEITKIDTHTGGIVWRMGGLRNQFTFLGSATPAFTRQHGMRVTRQGELELLDNLGDPLASRAERYEYDAQAGTARLIASYGSAPAVVAQLGGTTQFLAGGRTLVAFGSGGRVEEYDASGQVVWRIVGNPGYVFRAQRIRSLYQPGVGTPR